MAEHTPTDANEEQRFFDYEMTFVPPVTLKRDTTALVVVDMQYHDASPDQGINLAMERIRPGCLDYFNERNERQVVPGIARLIAWCRDNGVRVIYITLGCVHRDLRDATPRMRTFIRDLERRSGVEDIFWHGNPALRIRQELAPREGELVINKTTWGAFNGSNIDEVLREHGVESLVITGISTNCCVETTARDAAERGWGVVIVDEATADYDEPAHEAALRGFHTNFGRVLPTVDATIEALRTEATL